MPPKRGGRDAVKMAPWKKDTKPETPGTVLTTESEGVKKSDKATQGGPSKKVGKGEKEAG